MSQVELMYQSHLARLRELAGEKETPFVDILSLFSKAYKRSGLAGHMSKSAGVEQIKTAERMLIEEYRTLYYEEIANSLLELEEGIRRAVKIDSKQLERIKEKVKKTQHALKATAVQAQNLKLGRDQGAKKNKKRSIAVQCLAKQINKDLLTHVDTARWTLAKRADYIAQKLPSSMVEIDGNTYPATMVNGNIYSSSTIRTWITGT